MKQTTLLLLMGSVFLLTGCSLNADTESAEVSANQSAEEETPESQKESGSDAKTVKSTSNATPAPEPVAVTHPYEEEQQFYSHVTKEQMDDAIMYLDYYWKTHIIDHAPETVGDQEANSVFLDNVNTFAAEYEALADEINSMSTSGLGEAEPLAKEFQGAMFESIVARGDAVILLIECIEYNVSPLLRMDEYNQHIEDAMHYRQVALDKQALLESKLEIKK